MATHARRGVERLARILLLPILLAASSTAADAQTIEWTARWNGGMVDSYPSDVHFAIGDDGHRFAVAAIRNGAYRDFMTIAWDAGGNLLWWRLKDGDNGTDDVPRGVLVDPSGHVVVFGDARGRRLLTVVYDSAGNELWAQLERHPSYAALSARGLAVDSSGRVFVVAAKGTGVYNSAWIHAYEADGTPLWESEGDYLPGYDAVAADGSGNVAIGGESPAFGQSDDFLTVVYDLGGTELWRRFLDGEAHGRDAITALTADSWGRFLVTGSSEGAPASNQQILTAAYDIDGNELWATTTGGLDDDSVSDLVADDDGNVYLAGRSGQGTGVHALLVSLDADGNERWASLQPDSGGATSGFLTVRILPAGGVFGGGYTYVDPIEPRPRALMTRFDPDSGAELWSIVGSTPLESLAALSAAADGSFLVGGVTGPYLRENLLAVSYDAFGLELWSRSEPEIPAADSPGYLRGSTGRGAIAAGYDDRVYVTGRSFDGSVEDAMTVAFDSGGHKLWEARKSASNDFSVLPVAVAVDPQNGNAYVAAIARGTVTSMMTVAYDRWGTELWSRTKRGPYGGTATPCCIAVTPDRQIAVAGTTSDYGSGALTVVYEIGGNELWSDLEDPDLDGKSRILYSLVIGTTGTIYVGGTINGDDGSDFRTIAIDASGNRLWAQTRSAGDGVNAGILALAAAPDGGVIATGSANDFVDENALTVAYSPGGDERWSAVADGGAGRQDAAGAISVDPEGNSYVAGASSLSDYSERDFFVVAYSPTGQELWKHIRDGGFGREDSAASIAINGYGNLVVAGKSSNGSNNDMLTVAYSPGGYELFAQRYDNGGEDEGYLALAGPGASSFVGGMSEGEGEDFFFFKLLDISRLFADGFESGDLSSWSAATP